MKAEVTMPVDAAVAGASARHGRIGDIELLRAIAVIFVLIEHSRINLFTWIGGPETRLFTYFGFWNGVDLFFAISGFVIARSLLPGLRAAENMTAFINATLAFWVRRIWRLLPSAWLWLAVIMLCVVFFNRASAFGSFRGNFEAAIAAMLDVANFRIMIVFGQTESGASFPYWSLSLEEQFYFLLPFIVLVSRRWLPHVLIVGVAAQLFVTRSGVGTSGLGLILNQLRSDALLLGVLIAIWSSHPTYRLFEPIGLLKRPLLRLIVLVALIFCLAAAGIPKSPYRMVSDRSGRGALRRAGPYCFLRPGLSMPPGDCETAYALDRQPILCTISDSHSGIFPDSGNLVSHRAAGGPSSPAPIPCASA